MQETSLIEQEQPVGVLTRLVPVPAPTMTLCSYGTKLTRDELARRTMPAATATSKPIPHIAVEEKLIEVLGFRQIGVVREEYAVSSDGMRMFGVMDLSSGFYGCRFHADCPIMPTIYGCRSSEGARPVFQSAIRGVSTSNHVEPVERVHIGIQRDGADRTIPSDR